MKKITIIINNLGAGGAERYVVDSINEMLKRGIDVHLVTLKPEKGISLAAECNIESDHCTTIHFRSLYSITKFYSLIKLLREQKPDVVYTHLWFSNTIGRFAAYLAGVPKIFSMEHSMHFSKSWKQRCIDKLFQVFSHKIIAVSKSVQRSLIQGGISASRISVIYVALNTKKFIDIPSSLTRKDLGIGEDEFVFLYVGRLNPPKNISTIIKAFHLLDRGVLCIAGVGESEHELRNVAQSLFETRVRFLGFVKDIPSLMKLSNCFVFVPLWEALGLVAVEALLSGVPVITTKNSAMSEFVIDEHNGLLVSNPTDVEEVGNVMKKVMNDGELLERLKSNTKNMSIDFSIEHNIDMLFTLLN